MRPLISFLPAAAGLLVVALSARAQTPVRALTLVPEVRYPLGRLNQTRDAIVAVGRDGRLVWASRTNYGGGVIGFDSAGKPLPWHLPTGRGDSSEIMFPARLGWISGTSTVWVGDFGYNQVALADANGKIFKSLEFFSWVHPTWAERRKYPVFASMDPLAVYPDYSMLIIPGRERSLIDTPGYDHSARHLLHVSASGTIERDVVSIPAADGRILPNATGCSHTLMMPFASRTELSVSPDGMRISVVAPPATDRDSGTFRVTTLGPRGDTVYSRSYPQPVVRNSAAAIDSYLAAIEPCGTATADELRKRALQQIREFKSLVTGAVTGDDGSVAVLLHAASDTSRLRTVMMIDPRGGIVGTTSIVLDQTVAAVSSDRLWVIEPGKNRDATIVRYRLNATPAPLPRSGPTSASSRLSRPPT